ncbi:putative cytochrome [Rosellinia necatrix]|uniref:Putative cytochrome n=1 Tax=Rosellinia necatrix TaxID=77044 RepID=A0A1W2TFR0_ROSNE|nr:putative cytochrome [Rosellinia necatrix]
MDTVPLAESSAILILKFLLLYVTFLGTYRLLCHPLRHYPGPLFARVSGIYGAFYAYKTDLHRRTLRDHARFGPIIRQGPNKLVFNSISALHDIYVNDRVTKSRAYLVTQRAPGVYGVFNAIDKQLHQAKRKLVSRVVNKKSLRALEPTINHQIDIFLHQLSLSGSRASLNMTKVFKYLTMDIMGHIAFSYPFNLQTEETHRCITDTTNANYLLNIAMQLPFIAGLRIFNFSCLRALIRGNRYRQSLESAIKYRISQGHQGQHELLYMTDTMAVPDDENASMEAMRNEAIFFLGAGSDTLSSTLSALFHYLSVNRRCYERLTSEIRSTFADKSEIQDGPRLASCQYLRACIDEALRMCPPLPGTLWRQGVIDADKPPLFIDGHYIPPGTEIGVNTYALHYNADYFPEPYIFKPERWLPSHAAASATVKAAFIPFSIGPRACVGKAMAYLEASLVVAKTLWAYDFETTTPDNRKGVEGGVYSINDMLVASHDGPYLCFHPRKG